MRLALLAHFLAWVTALAFAMWFGGRLSNFIGLLLCVAAGALYACYEYTMHPERRNQH